MGGNIAGSSGSFQALSDAIETYNKREAEEKKISHPEMDV